MPELNPVPFIEAEQTLLNCEFPDSSRRRCREGVFMRRDGPGLGDQKNLN